MMLNSVWNYREGQTKIFKRNKYFWDSREIYYSTFNTLRKK